MRVLVVEDEPRMASVLRRGLTEEGYAVDVAGDGIDGLWMASEFTYDAIVLDVMLPGLDGFEVCRRLRAAEHWTPVVMVSARGDVGDRIHGLDAGADDYLGKPFKLAELAARLRALRRRGQPPRPTVLIAGDLRLDPAARRAWTGDRELSLSSREFALLELFCQHPGEVLTRTRILDDLWDTGFDGVSNVVDQYVGYVRRKLKGADSVAELETVRGVGYRLRC
ncbi:MAG: response regulator transcription factor [Acidimicrobiales bacterium]